MNILIAQRDRAYLARLVEQLQSEGVLVTAVTTAAEVQARALEGKFDALILGLIFEDMSGVQLCRMLRRTGVSTPIMMLSVLDDVEAKIECLDAGADEYLPKPVDIRELNAHLRALIRRCRGGSESCIEYGDLELDIANRGVRRAGQPIILTPREFAVLELLVRNRERVLSRAMIGDRVWGVDYRDDGSNVVDVYVSRLRRKIDSTAARPLIHTAPGIGYVLSAQAPGAGMLERR